MVQKIGIITKNLSFFNLLNNERRSNPDYEMELIKTIDALKKIENMGKLISCFIFDSTHTADDIIEFGKHITSSKRYLDVHLFLAFENFETFQAISVNEYFSKAKVINMPASALEIYSRLTSEIKPVEVKKTSSPNGSSASFLNIFIDSTIATIKEMTACEQLTHSAPSILDYKKMDKGISIRGKLSIVSTYFTGSFFISFPEATYLKLCSKVLYEEVTRIDKENEDLVSELCNIIYGKSKVIIAKMNMKLDMVIPTYNRNEKIEAGSSILVVKFASEMGEFYVKVAPGLT